MSSNDPEWLEEGEPTKAHPSDQSDEVLSSNTNKTNPNDPPYKAYVKSAFSFFFLGGAFMMACTGALGIGTANGAEDTGTVFVGLYLLMFAAMLFIFELVLLKPITSIEMFFKKNFGFLYGPIGKSIFLIFIGILSFGLESPRPLAIGTGCVMVFLATAVLVVNGKWPEYFDKHEKYHP
mmetsp:Transcript_3851/g.5995  ORF Transcript_3851/g.5995 Transcript_3851/m.5995 type:complete len:179 (+) Transcript_3851:41-577(+)|eukprot:CAMPEP_0185024162 /NCGR_PEP_ID=MMETSP1103-20130426/7133_1 /TAXON_ID=36769 /ORGANISM="Paraphysomonas bandaiensis, Strain Caron Lab Isolate" /LENGTH=178 /DNA_ID=CAMNT_0027557053 /DNA_START=41 /DNA_END=577 /DNA_ORIENTATION=+